MAAYLERERSVALTARGCHRTLTLRKVLIDSLEVVTHSRVHRFDRARYPSLVRSLDVRRKFMTSCLLSSSSAIMPSNSAGKSFIEGDILVVDSIVDPRVVRRCESMQCMDDTFSRLASWVQPSYLDWLGL